MIHFIGHVGEFDTEYWIRKHIFPGGWIPSLARAIECMEQSGLEVLDVENLRRHYALTLDAWAERFDANWDAIHALDPKRFDEYFRRKWRTYLWSCAEMFRSPNGQHPSVPGYRQQGQYRSLLSDEPGPSLSRLSMTPYEAKKARLLDELAAARAQGGATVGLAKQTSNLFRDRAVRKRPRVDLSHFNAVLNVDPVAGTVEAEGMTTFVDLADATLAAGTMPCVVPQLKSITLGGAVAGVGIEASSFRFGLVHDTISEIEVLTGDGRALVCTPDNEHRDLFHALPNSYGTLGYALKLTARTTPVKRHVHVEHRSHGDPAEYFAELGRLCEEPGIDFLDGVVFARDALVVTIGRFVEAAPYASDYTFERIYYRSLRERKTDYLTTRDYLWRWDTDWFWCSQNLGLQRRWLRRLVGRRRLNSITYQKIMRWNSRWKVTAAWDRLRGLHAESVIQDVDIPLARAAEFLDFLHAQIGIVPIWICPIRAPAARSVISAVSADARRRIHQFRILGQRQNPAGASCRLSQPQDRAQGHGARRHQIALFRFLFHAGRILGNLQPAGV